MARPRPAPRAETLATYLGQGRRHLRRAQAAFPALPREEALLRAQRDDVSFLAWSSGRRYLQDHRAILRELVEKGACPDLDIDAHLDLIRAELKRRSRLKRVKQTSAKKVRTITQEEAGTLFEALKRRALEDRVMSAAAAALFIAVMPAVGLRPIELVGATIQDGILRVKNAKLGPEHAVRSMDVSALHPSHVAALGWLIVLAEQDADDIEAWHSRLAEVLARSSEATIGRRIAPYACRHIALATWEKAGYTPEEIARLAGHLDLRSARRHYARAAEGWSPDQALARAPATVAGEMQAATAAEAPGVPAELAPPASSIEPAAPPADQSSASGEAISAFDIEPFPEPKMPVTRRSGPATDEVRHPLKEWAAKIDAWADRVVAGQRRTWFAADDGPEAHPPRGNGRNRS